MAYANPAAGKRRSDYTEASIASLTGAVGTANNALEDVTATPDQDIINANFADLAGKVNAILVELRKAGVISS